MKTLFRPMSPFANGVTASTLTIAGLVALFSIAIVGRATGFLICGVLSIPLAAILGALMNGSNCVQCGRSPFWATEASLFWGFGISVGFR